MNEDFLQSEHGRKLQQRYHSLKEDLSSIGWLTHGSVTPNHPGHWRWTSKVKGKTVTLALSQEQADLFKTAIANQRKLKSLLNQMHAISQEILLNSAQGIRKKSPRAIHSKTA